MATLPCTSAAVAQTSRLATDNSWLGTIHNCRHLHIHTKRTKGGGGSHVKYDHHRAVNCYGTVVLVCVTVRRVVLQHNLHIFVENNHQYDTMELLEKYKALT